MKALRYGLTALTAGVVLVLFWPLLGELRESASLLLALTFGFAVWRAVLNRARTQRWLMWAQMGWNRLTARLGRPPASRLKLMRRARRFYAGLDRLRQAPMRGFWLASFSHMALDLASLWACFAAFGYSMPAGTLLTGYGLMLLLSSLSALPGGLGIADASLAVIFARLGAPGAVALAGALLYRLIAFWLLRLIGFVTWQALEAKRKAPTPNPTTGWPVV